MSSTTASADFHRTAQSNRAGTWLARVLAALDRACASSADGARGF